MDMKDIINKEFEDFQKDLETRSKKLKGIVRFKPDDKIDELIKDLKEKTIML